MIDMQVKLKEYDAASVEAWTYAGTVEDLEGVRIAIGNRLRSFGVDPKDVKRDKKTGKVTYTAGDLVAGYDELERLIGIYLTAAAAEHEAILGLQRLMRVHPLAGWIEANPGLGEKQVGRLLGALGNPYWNDAAGRPRRGPGELWAYCGYHVLSVSRQSHTDAHASGAADGHSLPTSDQASLDTQRWAVAGGDPSLTGDHARHDAQRTTVPGEPLLPTSDQGPPDTHPTFIAGGDPSSVADHTCLDAQCAGVGDGPLLPAGDQHACDPQRTSVPSGHPLHPGDHASRDAHARCVAGVAPRREKGVQSNWNGEARMRAHLIAETIRKAVETRGVSSLGNPWVRPESPYRHFYVEQRAKYAGAIHPVECSQCGICASCGQPPGKNKAIHAEETGCERRSVIAARPGDPLKPGHIDARALRYVAKMVLKDLWIAARDWHLAES